MPPVPALELRFRIKADDLAEAKDFLNFLRNAARRHSVTIAFAIGGSGDVTLSVPGRDRWNLGLFLQELLLTRGLYYYVCTVPNRRQVARAVVKPIAEDLLLSCFSVVYPVFIQKHLLEGSETWPAGEFSTGAAQDYELLFQRHKLKMISGYEFIRDLDDLLTAFMLRQLGHRTGDRSPNFNVLVDRCGKQDVLRDERVRKLFNKVHVLRTMGLHRLLREIPTGEVSEIAQSMYNVFEWLNDYWKAQDEKTVVLSGQRYRRVRYGQELRQWKRNASWRREITEEFEARWLGGLKRPCHDCGIVVGEVHLEGCDYEACPSCGGQYICCDCRRDEDYEV